MTILLTTLTLLFATTANQEQDAPAGMGLYHCVAEYESTRPYLIFAYESFYVPYEGVRERLDKLEKDYRQAIADNPPPEVNGLEPTEIECTSSFRNDRPRGTEANRIGGTTTFLPTPNYLRNGEGYAPAGRSGEGTKGAAAKPITSSTEQANAATAPAITLENDATRSEAKRKTAADYEAEYQRRLADYEKQSAEQKRQVEEFERAKAAIERLKEEQRAKAEASAAEYRKQQDAHAELLRRREAEIASTSATPSTAENEMRRMQEFWGQNCAQATERAMRHFSGAYQKTGERPYNGGCTVTGYVLPASSSSKQ